MRVTIIMKLGKAELGQHVLIVDPNGEDTTVTLQADSLAVARVIAPLVVAEVSRMRGFK